MTELNLTPAKRNCDGQPSLAPATLLGEPRAYTCPFCGEAGFDGEGLKGHLIHEDCEEYRNLKPPMRLFA
jgi:hypothetical protein